MSDTSSQPADQAQPADFLTAFWAVKHALARTSATAFDEHGIYEAVKPNLSRRPENSRRSSRYGQVCTR